MRSAIALACLLAANGLAQTLPQVRPLNPASRRAPAAPSKAANSAVASYRDLKFPPMGPIEMPKVETVTLPNGLRLYLLEDHELPVIHGLALVRTGRLFEPKEKAGLASLTGQLLRTGGAGSRSFSQIEDDLGNAGARIESRIGETSGAVSFTGLKESVSGVLEIYRDVLTKPQFDPDQVDAAKGQLRAAISNRNADVQQVMRREFAAAIFGKSSPMAQHEEYDTVAAIKRRDVQEFYSRYYFPKNTMLAVWGDFEAARMKDDLTRLFADWTATGQPVPAFPAAHAAEPATYLGVRKDFKQVAFSMGLMGGKLNDADYPALEIAVSILGRGDQSRLARKFRGKTDLGETAFIRADWGADFETPGVFQINGVIPSFQAVALLKAVEDEAGLLRAGEVTDQELAGAKTEVAAGLAFGFDTKGKALGRLLEYEYAGYPKDMAQQLQKSYAAVTKADVLRVSKQYLDPSKFTLVVLGNPTQFIEDLGTLGRKVTPLDLTIPEATVKAVDETAEALALGKKILAEAQAAAGGVDALIAAKDYTENSEVRLDPAAGGSTVTQVVQWASPNYLRVAQDQPTGALTFFTDGAIGWVALRQNSTALGGNDLKKIKGDLFRMYLPLLLSDHIPGRKIAAAEENSIEISDAGGNSLRADFDLKTHLLHKLVYTNITPTGQPQAMVETYSDFRDVNGIKIPFKVSAEIGGRKYAEGTIRDVKLNTGLKAEELRKRP